MFLNIWQIYFDDRSRKNCFDDWKLYNNSDKLTEYFENSVIVDLYNRGELKKCKYFGVFSHDVLKTVVHKEDGLIFRPENLETVINNNQHIDVFSFQKRRQNQNVILQAENYHKGFVSIIETILERTGFLSVIPRKLNHIVLFNYVVARREIYQRYIEELLIPAMEVLKDLPEAYKNAEYRPVRGETLERFKKGFGLNYYPYHPFILERLWSLFLEKYNYQFKQIF